MNAGELLRRLKKEEPGPAYFFTGPEVHLQKKVIGAIVAAVPDSQRDFNVDVFSGGEQTLEDAVGVARTLPFLAPRRVVVYHDIEKSGSTPAKASVLHAYLEDPSPSTTLIVTSAGEDAARGWRKKLSGSCEVVDFKPLRGGALEAAVREAAKEREVSIGRDALERLVESVGRDLQRLTQEVEKLALAVGPGGRIGVEEVSLLVCGYAYHTTFTLVQAICRRDLPGSLRLLDGMPVGTSDVMGLIGMLAKRMRLLWHLTRGGDGTVPASFRVQKWQVRDLKREAAAFTRAELEGFLEDLLSMDRSIKTSSHEPDILLQKFIYDVCRPPQTPASG